MGAPIPFRTGSPVTARIGNLVFVCGGIDEEINDTVDTCAMYDTDSDTWDTSMAPMPEGVNHAAAGADGEFLYVFGGRKGRNNVGTGYDYV